MITAVFADLVGSTTLGERLDPEELKLIVGDAVARVIDAVESFGGTIKDLAGDGVLALFGAPTAHEDDPERAVRASLRIVEEIGDYAQEVEGAWGVGGFGVRVGVQTGPVVVGAIGAGGRVEYAALGDAVNTAARLQSAAGPGEVLVGEATLRLVEPMFDWGEPTELELKGKSEPVAARVAQAATGVRAGMRGLEGVEARLIGRERELDEGRRAVAGRSPVPAASCSSRGSPASARRGWSASCATCSRPERRNTVAHCGWRVDACPTARPCRTGRSATCCAAGSGSSPTNPSSASASRSGGRPSGYSESAPASSSRTSRRSSASRSSRRPRSAWPSSHRRRSSTGRSRSFERSSPDLRRRVRWPSCWRISTGRMPRRSSCSSDSSATEGTALLLVLTSRLERDHPWWRAKEDAARQLPHRVTDLTLEALSGDAGRELLHALVGEGTLPDDVERRILEPAEGNPFFLEELIRSLVDAGAVTHDEGAWRFVHDVPLEVPPTVEKVILARIDRLDAGARDALVAASVLGRQFGLPLLEAVVEGEDGAVRQSLLDLMRLDLVREGRRWPEPEYRFKHALIQEAAYRTLVTVDRNRLHREAATWLEVAVRRPGGRGRGPACAPLAGGRRRGQGRHVSDDRR